ncbi:partitioning defective 3 homolog isoform X3 [Ptychodera flava]|uniref:partitioning defective 3 homolog isoform X3 n=1 Tax=Ptychodera flava TaxID=63121 RepID=UPI00396A3278
MKVVVCFGEVKIVVPCGNGELLVRDLIEKSILRYKKATGKPPDYWVNVRSLENLSDGGILDPDDQVYDVADDREKLLAIFEEQGRPLPPHNGGDGTSASSAGTASPEMFHSEIASALARDRERGQKVGFQPYISHDIDVDVTTSLQVTDNKLHVRHGSEPALRSMDPESYEEESRYDDEDKGKRWSTVAAFEDVHGPASNSPVLRGEKTNGVDRTEGEQFSAFSRFGRDSARQSILGNHPAMYKWAEAQDKVGLETEQNRHDPVGGDLPVVEKSPADGSSQDSDMESFYVDIQNDGEPMGLHVVPYTDHKDGRELGMLVRGVEKGSKAFRNGRIVIDDRIVEINNLLLAGISFERAQEIFREAMTQFPYVRLRIERDKQPSRQVSEEDSPLNSSKEDSPEDRKDNFQAENIPDLAKDARPATPVRRKPPPVVPLRSPTTVLTTTPMKDRTNVRKIGKKIHIQLTKGPQGLGFSITTRDNPAGGKNPIYIKNILPKGAAIADGRLKPGDRLLEVNGMEMTGKPQADAVSILRSTKLGSVVHLVVSRQEHVSAKLPRQMPNQEPEDPTPNKTKEILTFDIALNDTGSAGLGVSVKGKTTGSGKGEIRDLGIFIKAVIHGGAASKDGRLRQNDQLLYINDVSLLKLSNSEAMETLRKAMSNEKSPRSTIKLVVARRIDSSPSSPSSFTNLSFSSSDKAKSQESLLDSSDQPIDIGLKFSKSEDNLNQNAPSSHASAASASASETSENSDNTVLYNPPMDTDGHPDELQEVMRHRLVKRLSPGSALARNNSYNLAMFTTDGPSQRKFTVNNDSPDGASTDPSFTPSHSIQGFVAPTLPMGNTETVIIEDTDTEQDNPAAEKSLSPQASSSPKWSKEWEDTDAKSPEDDDKAFFQRDGFGRQSISEKHKGTSTIDAKQTDWYAKHRKQNSDATDLSSNPEVTTQPAPAITSPGTLVRVNSADSLLNRSTAADEHAETESSQSRPASPAENSELGPALGMVKSSSLESLQTMVAQVATDDDTPYPRPKAKVVRGRGCNESFRAAVDRSYDDRNQDDDEDEEEEEEEPLEAVEEISDELESRSRSPTGSTRSSVDSLTNTSDPVSGKPLKPPKQKKKGGSIFKGLFKFGQKRRPYGESRQSESQKTELMEKQKQEEIERYKARQAAKDEHQRIQEQHRKLREQQALQKQLEQQQQQLQNRNAGSQEAVSKAERMLQLRQQHQQRHQQRQGQYARDDLDNAEDNQTDSNNSNYSSTDAHISQYLTQREQRFQEPSSSSVAKATDSEYNKSRYQEGRDSPNPYGASPSKPRTYNYMDHTKPELRYSDYYAQQPRTAYSYGSLGRPSKLQAQTQPHSRSQLSDRGHSNVQGRTTPSLPVQKQAQSQTQPQQGLGSRGQYHGESSQGRATPSLRTDYQGRSTPYRDVDASNHNAGNYADPRNYTDQGNYSNLRNYENSGHYGDRFDHGDYRDTRNNHSSKYAAPKSYRHSSNLDDDLYYGQNRVYGDSRNSPGSRHYRDARNYADSRNNRETSNYGDVHEYGDARYFYRDTRDPEKV